MPASDPTWLDPITVTGELFERPIEVECTPWAGQDGMWFLTHDGLAHSEEGPCVATDGNHDGPIFPDLAKRICPTAPNVLWVADISYIAIARGFVYLSVILDYLSVILDAWSRRVVGYALGRRIDTRLTLSALEAAIGSRKPLAGCIHHSDSQRGRNIPRSPLACAAKRPVCAVR